MKVNVVFESSGVQFFSFAIEIESERDLVTGWAEAVAAFYSHHPGISLMDEHIKITFDKAW